MDSDDKLAQLKQSLIEASLVKCADDLKVGTIVYVELDKNDGLILTDGYPTRLKYIIVAGNKSDKKEYCAVLINSDDDYSESPEWKEDQYPLLQQNYLGILDYNSWLDCTDPKTLSLRKLKARKAEIKGRLTDDDLKAVMTKLKESDFIDPHTKKVFGIDTFVIS